MTFRRSFEMFLLVVLVLIGFCTNEEGIISQIQLERQNCATLLGEITVTRDPPNVFESRVMQHYYPGMDTELQRCIELWNERVPATNQVRRERNRFQAALDFLNRVRNGRRHRVNQAPNQNRQNRPPGNYARVQPILPPAPIRNPNPYQDLGAAALEHDQDCAILIRQHEFEDVQMPEERIRVLLPHCIALWNRRIAQLRSGTVRHERLNRQLRLLHTIRLALPRLPRGRDDPRQRDVASQKKASSNNTLLWIGLFALALVICSIGAIVWIRLRNTANDGTMSRLSSASSQASGVQVPSSQA